MRKKLRALRFKKRPTFTAVFSKFGSIKTSEGNVQTALLYNVAYKGRVVANHVWINETRPLCVAGVKKGSLIRFKATISEYLKGYFGKQPVLGKSLLQIDYGLIYISDVKIVEL